MNNFLKTPKRKASFFLGTIYSLFLTGMVFANNGNNEEYVRIPNPLRFETIHEFLTELINLLIWIGLALIPLMVVIGGAFYMFGGLNPENVEKGKNIIKWTVVGVFIIVGARAVLWLINYVFS